MKLFTLSNRPHTRPYRKTGSIQAALVREPFQVDTQEGVLTISPTTVDDWQDGYWVAYPSDGSKPYAIAPAFMKRNYVWTGEEWFEEK
jgi:hypothetical protein